MRMLSHRHAKGCRRKTRCTPRQCTPPAFSFVETRGACALDLTLGRPRSVICGDGAVGKTCVFNRSFEALANGPENGGKTAADALAAASFDPTDQEYEPTIFEDYSGGASDVLAHLRALPRLDEAITVTLRDTAGARALARQRWQQHHLRSLYQDGVDSLRHAGGCCRSRGVRCDQRRQLPERGRLYPGVCAHKKRRAVRDYT